MVAEEEGGANTVMLVCLIASKPISWEHVAVYCHSVNHVTHGGSVTESHTGLCPFICVFAAQPVWVPDQ